MKSSLRTFAVLALALAGGALAAVGQTRQQGGQAGAPTADRSVDALATDAADRLALAGAQQSRTGDAGDASIARGTPPSPTLVLRSAMSTLERHQTVVARLRFRIDLLGQRLTGSGSYLQGPAASRLSRFEANLQAGDQLCSLQQVCDGQRLWTRRQLLDNPTLTCVDLSRVLEAAEQSSPAPDTAVTNLALGGLPLLLRSLDGAFQFDRATHGQRNSLKTLALRGRWKPSMLALLLPDQAAAIQGGGAADLTRLLPQVPDEVVLHLGQEDLFPYCVEYLRTPASVPNGKNALLVGEPRTLLILEFFEVRTNGTLDPLKFVFNPGGLTPADVTAEFLQSLQAKGK
jgi:hypothetical protein